MALRNKNAKQPSGTSQVQLGNQRLFLDDLEALLAQLEEDHQDTEIQVGQRVADTVQDIQNATNDEIGRLVITCSNPNVTIFLQRSLAAVNWQSSYDVDQNFKMEFAANRAATFLNSTRSMLPFWRLASFWFTLFLALSATFQWLTFGIDAYHQLEPSLFLAAFSTLLTLFWGYWFLNHVTFDAAQSSTRIVRAYRKDRRWGINDRRSEWMIGMTTGLGGLILGIVLGRIF